VKVESVVRLAPTLALVAILHCGGRASGPRSAVPAEGDARVDGSGAPATTGGAMSADAALVEASDGTAPDAATEAHGSDDASEEDLDGGTDEGPGSCVPGGPGMTNCGPDGSDEESCCTSLQVTGGTYYRTYDPTDGENLIMLSADGGPTAEADPATVSSFRLDKYDVTVGRFRQFVKAWKGGWVPAPGSGKHSHLNSGNGLSAIGGGYEPGWVAPDDVHITPTDTNLAGVGGSFCPGPPFNTWTPMAGTHENLPIDCVNWYEAYAFCIWDRGFLPSAAEWEYAAAGGNEQREYPWGATDPGTASAYAIYGCDYPSPAEDESFPICLAGVGNLAPVGNAMLGAGLWGQLDLVGNVSQWNVDGYGYYTEPCTDCADFTLQDLNVGRVVHGGSFQDAQGWLTPARYTLGNPQRRDDIGFRCARTP
jgi:sulfatase modifying factor 1